MKRRELIDKYSKLLKLKSYSQATEKFYLHHLNLFLDYVNKSLNKEIDGGFRNDPSDLLNYFTHLKQTKNFSYSSMNQSLAFTRFLFIDVLNKDIDFDFFIKMKKP